MLYQSVYIGWKVSKFIFPSVDIPSIFQQIRLLPLSGSVMEADSRNNAECL